VQTNTSFLLKKRKERIFRKELLLFYEVAGLYLMAGYDLPYAWSESMKGTGWELNQQLGKAFEKETLLENLERLEKHFSLDRYRFTFGLLKQLYIQGAPLGPVLRSFSQTLRRELERDLEAHLRTAPTRANLTQMVFFLPPTLALLVLPFLQYLRRVFLSL